MNQINQKDLERTLAGIQDDNKNHALNTALKFATMVEDGTVQNFIIIGYNLAKDHDPRTPDKCEADIFQFIEVADHHALCHLPGVVEGVLSRIKYEIAKKVIKSILPSAAGKGGH